MRTACRLPALILLVLAACSCAAASWAAEAVDLAVVGGTVLTMAPDGAIVEDGYVAIRKNRIVAVGTRAALARKYRPRRTIAAAGKLVMPGLVNTHTHAPMSLFRGIANDLALKEWLEKHIFPAESRNVDRDFVYWGTLLAAAEMIRSGTTTFCDMYFFEDEVARATKQAGLRAVLGQALLDFPAPDNKTFDAMLASARKFLETYRNDPLVTPAVAPHAPYTVSPEHLLRAKALADEFRAPLVIHLAETKGEEEAIRAGYGARPVRHLKDIGFLGDRVVAGHCVWLDDEDISILEEAGVGCAHNPSSNMMLASGVAPVAKMLDAGMDVGLGTDGPAGSNNDFDLFEEIDLAPKLQKISGMNPRLLPARRAVEMATIGGARVLGMEKEIGSLEPGKKADLILVGLDRPHEAPVYDLHAAIAYSIKGSDVDTVIVDGRIVMLRGRIPGLDEKRIVARAREYRTRILTGRGGREGRQ